MLRINPSSVLIANRPVKQEYVPLQHVNVEVTLKSFAADVTIKQVFRNDETTPIEAVYFFPIEEQAAIYAFTARIDDREIIAELKEKKEAQKEYSNALQQGHGAYLLEQDEKSQDNFIINVGALLPGKECHISISYVSELDLVQDGRKIRFVIPTTIAPRFNSNKGSIDSPAGTTSKYVQTSPYTIEFHCLVDKIGISRVSSSSHPIQIDLGQPDVYIIEFAQQNTHLDRDILIDIDLAENRSNTIVAVEPGAIMASFTPTQEDCRRVMNNVGMTNEFIFVVDCSGSMRDENKIGLARQAMLLFLKSLPNQCYFNIVRFGSTHQTLFNEITALYNEENVRKAEQLTKQMQADLGGTELLKPFQWLEKHPPVQGRARQIFLLTDGEISDVDQVLDLCRSMASSARIFSYGLGHSPSRSLVKGLAQATNGRFVFIPPNSSVDVHVGEQLQKALQSSITNVQVKWNLNTSVISVPMKTPPVYANDRLLVYALADDSTSVFDHDSTVELYADQHRLGEAIIDHVPSVSNNGTIARLAAKALIVELQHAKLPAKNIQGSLQSRFQEHQQSSATATIDEKETTKKRIIELSLKHKILSTHTAFVGVEKRTNGNNAEMVLREVPIQISADDQHLLTRPSTTFRPTSCLSRIKNSISRSPAPMSISATSLMRESLCRSSNPSDTKLRRCFRTEQETKATCSFNIPSLSRRSEELVLDECQNNVDMEEKEATLPTDDQNLVRYLINKQKFDGLWELDTKTVEQLTGKLLTNISSSNNHQVLISAIVVVVLETRFASFSTMWYGIVQKARQRLLDLLGNDSKQFDSLLKNIRKQL